MRCIGSRSVGQQNFDGFRAYPSKDGFRKVDQSDFIPIPVRWQSAAVEPFIFVQTNAQPRHCKTRLDDTEWD